MFYITDKFFRQGHLEVKFPEGTMLSLDLNGSAESILNFI